MESVLHDLPPFSTSTASLSWSSSLSPSPSSPSSSPPSSSTATVAAIVVYRHRRRHRRCLPPSLLSSSAFIIASLTPDTWRKDVKSGELKAAIDEATPRMLRAMLVSEVSWSFHPNFSAKWRRYFYIFPLIEEQEMSNCSEKECSNIGCSEDDKQLNLQTGDDEKGVYTHVQRWQDSTGAMDWGRNRKVHGWDTKRYHSLQAVVEKISLISCWTLRRSMDIL